MLGYGGTDADAPPQPDQRKRNQQLNYNQNSPVQILGHGPLMETQLQVLTPEEREVKARIEADPGR